MYFNNLLARDNWAAIHYQTVFTESSERKVKSMVQFFRFVEDEDGVKIAEAWNK